MKRVKELSKTKSDTGGLPLLDIHRYEITNNTKYDEVYIDKVHGSNTDGNITTGVEQQINMLPVPDTNNSPGMILKKTRTEITT